MGYKKADSLWPRALLLAVQQYVDGEYLYIPRKQGCKRAWGETTKARESLRARNRRIAHERANGAPVPDLAERYFLSEKTIYKICASAAR